MGRNNSQLGFYTLLLLTFGQLQALVSAQTQANNYGEECSGTTISCNANLWLECSVPTGTGVCRCQSGTHLNLNLTPPSCVAKVGGQCTSRPEDGSPLKLCTENADCLYDSVTGTSSCYCSRQFLEDETGGCLGGIGGPCSANVHCKQSSFLSCSTEHGNCTCDLGEGLQIWNHVPNPKDRQCVSLVGSDCTPLGHYTRPCVQGSACNSSTLLCECDQGFTMTPDRQRCVKNRGMSCEVSSECAPGLICKIDPVTFPSTPSSPEPTSTSLVPETSTATSPASVEALSERHFLSKSPDAEILAGTCDCPEGQEFNGVSQHCEMLVGGTCGAEQPPCVEHAGCASALCTCLPNYIPTEAGRCAGGHGANCSSDLNLCSSSHYLHCSSNDQLCTCNDGYNFLNDRCVGSFDVGCAEDADCEATTSLCDPTRRTCQCNSGYVPSPPESSGVPTTERHCVGGFGTPCSGILPCYTYAFLSCSGTTNECECENPQDQEYVEGDEQPTCKSLSRGSCTTAPVDGRTLTCTGNATCTPGGESSICTCDANFIEDEFRRCKLNNSAPGLRTLWIPFLPIVILWCKSQVF